MSYRLITVILFFIIAFEAEAAIVFTKEASPYYISEDYVVSNGDTLIFESGSILILSPSANIITNGVILIKGLPEDRVSFLPEVDEIGWGTIEITCPGKTSIFDYVDIVDGSIYSWYCDVKADNLKFYNSQDLPWYNALLYIMQASGIVTNSAIYGSYKGEGWLFDKSEVAIVRNCYLSKIPDAVEFIDIVGGQICNNIFEDIHDDAIDLNNCKNTIIDSNIISNVGDRGMEIGTLGSGSSENIIVRRNVITGCKQGVTFKEESYGHLINNTFYGNEIAINCIEDNATKTGSFMNVQNCIFSNSIENDVIHDTTSIVSLNYCISDTEVLIGNNNILGNPLFNNVSDFDFTLKYNSPCINAGNPELPLDPDNTIGDIGAYYYNSDTTNINNPNEILRSAKIFPNPFADYFTVILESSDIAKVELFNLSGELIPIIIEKEYTLSKNTIKIRPIPTLKSNTIVICKISDNNSFITKLILHK